MYNVRHCHYSYNSVSSTSQSTRTRIWSITCIKKLQYIWVNPRVSSSLHPELSSLSLSIFFRHQPQGRSIIMIRVYTPVFQMLHSPAWIRINLIIFTSQILNKTPEVISCPRIKAEVWYKLRRTVISIVFSYQVAQRRDTCLDLRRLTDFLCVCFGIEYRVSVEHIHPIY